MNHPSTTLRFGRHVRGLDAPTVLTDNLEEATVRVLEAAANRSLTFISGPVGTGKSYATARAVEAVEQHFPGKIDVAWIELSRSIKELALLCELFEQIAGVRAPSRPVAREMRQHLALILAEKHRLLILDEAQHISRPALLELRWFYDRADANFGLVCVGTEKLWKNVAPEMRSRACAHVVFERMSNHELLTFLTSLDPVFATVGAKRLRDLNTTHAHGELRWWAKFLLYTKNYSPDGLLDDDLIEAVLAAIPPA